MFLALVLSIAVHPIRRFADRHRLPAWVGMILSLLAVYGIVAGLFAILVVAGIQFATLLQDYGPQFQAFLQQAAQLLESVGVSQEKLQDFVNEISPSRLVGVAGSLLGGLAGVLSDIFFLIVLLFFTVADAGDFASKLEGITPRGQRLADVFDGIRSWIPPISGGSNDFRSDCRILRLHRTLDSRYPLCLALGTIGIYYQLHPQYRIHYRVGTTNDHRSA